MQVGGVNPSASLLHAAHQQQLSANVLSKAHEGQQAQGKAAAGAIAKAADETEQRPDGDERGSRFQATA